MMNLKVARTKKGWTQIYLSRISTVSPATISNIENKGIENIPVKTLEKLSKALGTTVSELFFSDEE